MHSRRDQVQAHLFTLSRVTAGLIRAEPDATETPMRRFTLGAVAGTALGAVALGGMVAFGFISPGISNSFKKEGTLVLEKDTGTRYIYLKGVLHPILNRTSALLITNQQQGGSGGPFGGGRRSSKNAIQSVSSKSLQGVPKGAPIGILGAPDVLPDPKALDARPWSICSAIRTQPDGTLNKQVMAYLGGAGKGMTEVREGQTMVVKGEDGADYLAWLDRKLRVTAPSALTALGYANVTSFDVKDSWLNSLPSGKDLRGPDVPGRGRPGPKIGGQKSLVGQLYRDPSGASFLLLPDGLSPLTTTEAALLLSDPQTKRAYPRSQVVPLDVGTAAVASAPRSARGLTATGFPAEPPEAVGIGSIGTRVPCYRVEAGTGGEKPKLRVAYRETMPGKQTPLVGGSTQTSGTNGQLADRVVVAPGTGMLVREEAPVSEAAPKLYLITDLGVKYQLADNQVAQKLGYNAAAAIEMPANVLDLVPTGPALTVEAAQREMAVNPADALAQPTGATPKP
ncbi:type VII secretion protein EccB [Streptomyces sp. NPDC005125]